MFVANVDSKWEISEDISCKEGAWAQKTSAMAARKGVQQLPIIIDLDTYEEKVEAPDMSMALVVVPPAAKTLHSVHSAESTAVRTDNTVNGETTSQASMFRETAGNGFNPASAGLICGGLSQGVGHVAARPKPWEGSPRWPSSHVGILTVQCARCLKWRVVPTKEQYETIREHILETPWVCENALQWRPDAHCDMPADLNQDPRMLWAIDKPNLPSSPPGWQRKVIVRKDCSTKFADVYYSAPDGKSLRSMVEISKYLDENPGSVPQGTHLNQFSFTIPKPLPGVWAAKKRSTMRSAASLSSSVGKGKKARAPQPLAKQLAQRLLHSTNPPLLPIAPSVPMPHGSPLVQPLGPHAPSYPPAPNFTNLPTIPLPPMPVPLIGNSHPHPSTSVDHHNQAVNQGGFFSFQRGMLTPSSGRSEPSSPSSVSRRKKQQQKSRLGVAASLSQNMKLPGILPLREPNGA